MNDIIMLNIIHENCKKQRILNQEKLKKMKKSKIKKIFDNIVLFVLVTTALYFVMWLVAFVEM